MKPRIITELIVEFIRMARTSNTDRYAKGGGWSFFQPICAKCVLVAERKLPWYSEEKYGKIYYTLRKSGCRCYYNASDLVQNRRGRKTSVIEIYKKFKDDIPFEEKVKKMQEIINNVCFD